MTNKAKLTFELLEQEMEIFSKEEQRRFTGGTDTFTWQQFVDAYNSGDLSQIQAGSYIMGSSGNIVYGGDIYGGQLNNVTIYTDRSSNSFYYNGQTYSFLDPQSPFGNSGNSGGGTDGGTVTGGGTGSSSNFNIALNIVSNALSTGLAFNQVYTTLGDAIFSNTPVSTNMLIKDILDRTPVNTFIEEFQLAKKLDGIAIIGVTGKLLGVTGAALSLNTLYNDIFDGNGRVEIENVADAAISVGSLFIKSNVVGLAVSAGWLIIQGDFE